MTVAISAAIIQMHPAPPAAMAAGRLPPAAIAAGGVKTNLIISAAGSPGWGISGEVLVKAAHAIDLTLATLNRYVSYFIAESCSNDLRRASKSADADRAWNVAPAPGVVHRPSFYSRAEELEHFLLTAGAPLLDHLVDVKTFGGAVNMANLRRWVQQGSAPLRGNSVTYGIYRSDRESFTYAPADVDAAAWIAPGAPGADDRGFVRARMQTWQATPPPPGGGARVPAQRPPLGAPPHIRQLGDPYGRRGASVAIAGLPTPALMQFCLQNSGIPVPQALVPPALRANILPIPVQPIPIVGGVWLEITLTVLWPNAAGAANPWNSLIIPVRFDIAPPAAPPNLNAAEVLGVLQRAKEALNYELFLHSAHFDV